jgi:hypothetical protein
LKDQKMTQQTTTSDLSPAERAALLNDWRAKNRARKAEQQRLQGRIYLETVDGANANALERALALHSGDSENSFDDATALAAVTRDIEFWSQAIGELSHLVAQDRENANVAASIAKRPEYLKRLRALAIACEKTWDAFLAVGAVGDDLRAGGYTPSITILPGAPLSYLAAFNPDNPMSQLAAFKKMLVSYGA